MKKHLLIMLAMMFAFAICLAACGSPGEYVPEDVQETEPEVIFSIEEDMPDPEAILSIEEDMPDPEEPETEETPQADDPIPLSEAMEVIHYREEMPWEGSPHSINDVEMTLQQFEEELDSIYQGARYRLVSYRSTRSADSFIFGASGAVDVFMSHSEAMSKLDSESEPWASAYREILSQIPTRPISGFGLGDFVEYGVDSVAILDITGDNIPDLIFTNVSRNTMMVSFSVYRFDGDTARKIIYIEHLEGAGVSSPYYHAYFTTDGRLIVNNNNTGFGRIHIFSHLDRIEMNKEVTAPTISTTIDIQSLLGVSLGQVRAQLGEESDSAGSGEGFQIIFQDELWVTIMNYPPGDDSIVFMVAIFYNHADSLTRFHFNGIDGTSTRADVRTAFGAPDEVTYVGGYFYAHMGVHFVFDSHDKIESITCWA